MKPASLLLALPLAFAFDWMQIEPGLELEFPRDHGSHPAYETEWWYITGQVEDVDARRFGFQFTVFRRGLDPRPLGADDSPMRARHLFLGHLAVADIEEGQTRFAERLRRAGTPLARSKAGELDLWVEDWSLRQNDAGHLEVRAADPRTGIGIDFELRPTKPLVLHGERGYSAKGDEPGNASAYVSWTRLATTGTLRVDDATFTVTGSSWYDHEFGSSVLADGVVGWDWFGLQLDDGREVMLAALRREDSSVSDFRAGTIVAVDGTTRALTTDQIEIEVRDTWQSPHRDATYPSRWILRVPSEDLELEVVPLLPDAELSPGGSPGIVYWEGPVEVRGPTPGRGYAELTGYAGELGGRF